jgi:hypothetical protein
VLSGAKRPNSPKSRENTSPHRSHASTPNSAMPAQVNAE